MSEKDAAILASKNSLRLAKEAGNQDYIRLNNKSISKCRPAVGAATDSCNVLSSLNL